MNRSICLERPFLPRPPRPTLLPVRSMVAIELLPIIICGILRAVLLFIDSGVYYSSFIILRWPLQRAVTAERSGAGCTGAWRYSFTSTVTQLNGKERTASARVRACTPARFRSCVRRNAKWTRHAAGRGLSRGSPTFFFLSFFSFFLFIGEGEGVLLDDSFNFLGPSLYFSSLFVDHVFLGFEWKSKSGG